MEVVFEGSRACKTVRNIAMSRGYPLWGSVEAQVYRSSRHTHSSSILRRAHNKSFKSLGRPALRTVLRMASPLLRKRCSVLAAA